MPDNDIPVIAFDNQLAYDVVVYDSFDYDDDDDSAASTSQPDSQAYFATLTQLGVVPAGQTVSIQPIHDSSAFVVESSIDNKPIKRLVALSFDEITAFSIVKDDETAMIQTFQFANFFLNNPADPISVAFTKVLNDAIDDQATAIDDFFAAQSAYNKCCFEDYMMAIAYLAMHPLVPNALQPAGSSSLKMISDLMGSKWPEFLGDIFVTKFTCTTADKHIILTFEVDITTLPFESEIIGKNIATLMGGTKMVKAQIFFNYEIGLNIFGTRLSIMLDTLTVPVGDDKTLLIKEPGISIDINFLFKFVVFTMKATFPFNVNGKTFDALASFVIDNDEAAIGVDMQGDHTSFPAPPGIKGLHFDEFGVGMGLFFKPPGFGLGIEGKFHIGEPANGNVVSLNDNTFALVCEYVGEVIEPKYASFYIPKLDFNTVVELFTDVDPKLDVPVNFTDLSFHWSDGLMDCVVLPDGTLSPGGYGFSAAVDLLSFGFYGDVELDINTGLTANVEISPIKWKNIFQLSGDGKGFSMKYDENGNPIRNNFVPKTKAEKDAVANATDKQIVSPGGPSLIINTLSMPILHLNAKASLFDLFDYSIAADINKDGIKFELDYGAILTEKMVCNLSNFHNFYGEFGYYIDKSIPLPTIAGVSLGSIPLKAAAGLHLSIDTSLSDIVIKAGGHFDFEGYHFTFGDFSTDINISKISDFVGAIVQYIKDEAQTIFHQLIDTAEHWAAAAGKGIVTGFDDAGKVMKSAFNKTEQEMTTILKNAGFAANVISNALRNGYNAASQDVAALLKQAGFDATTIGNAIKNTWSCGINDVSWALHEAGFAAEDTTKAIKSAFNATGDEVTATLKKWGYAAGDIATSLKDVYNAAGQDVVWWMDEAGYDVTVIGSAMRSAWNCSIDDVSWAMHWVGYGASDVARAIQSAFNATTTDLVNTLKKWGYAVNDIAKSLKDVYNAATQDVVALLNVAGYDVAAIGGALKSAWNCGIDDVSWAMHWVGYGADDVARAVKSAFNAAASDVTNTLRKWGYALNDVGNALKNVYGAVAQDVANLFKSLGIGAQDAANTVKDVYNLAINETASVLKNAGYAANDVASALKNAFNTSVNAVADAMKQVGYAADDVKNAFDELGGDFKSFADSTWGDVKHYLNPSNW